MFVFGGDMNGDGGTSNDLIYVHRDTSEMNFQTFTSGGVTYTAEQQAAAWDAFIAQDPYLSEHRGEYAKRGAVFLPMLTRADLSVAQDIFRELGKARHGLQFRVDMINVGNLLNSEWGVGQRLVDNRPLNPASTASVDSQGRMLYRMRVVDGALMSKSYEPTSGLGDVWQIRFGFRYTFN